MLRHSVPIKRLLFPTFRWLQEALSVEWRNSTLPPYHSEEMKILNISLSRVGIDIEHYFYSSRNRTYPHVMTGSLYSYYLKKKYVKRFFKIPHVLKLIRALIAKALLTSLVKISIIFVKSYLTLASFWDLIRYFLLPFIFKPPDNFKVKS